MFSSLFSSSQASIKSPFEVDTPDIPTIDTARFRRGIDNVRIDVSFGETLARTLRRLLIDTTEMIIKRHEGRAHWHQPPQPEGRLLVKFQDSYAYTMERAIYQARDAKNPQVIWLARLAIMSQVFQQVDQYLEQIVTDLKKQTLRSSKGQTDANKVTAMQEKSIWYSRNRNRLHDYFLSAIFRQIHTVEMGKINKLSIAILGVSHLNFINILYKNPILMATKADDEWLMAQSYMPIPYDLSTNKQKSIADLNQLLDDMFSLIEVAKAPEFHLSEADLPYDSKTFFPGVEQHGLSIGWQDIASNIPNMFSPKTKEQMSSSNAQLKTREAKKEAKIEQKNRFVCQKLLHNTLKNENLLPAIAASTRVMAGFQAASNELELQRVHEYYLGGSSQQAVKKRVIDKSKASNMNPETLFAALDKVAFPYKDDESLSLHFLMTFVRYRHDLKIALMIKKHLLRIHLLKSDADLRLSEANGVLHYFSSDESEQEKNDGDIIGHVIIKADVRGSIGITQSLHDKDLNPATHFSRTFFDPITNLLPHYGAEKVFVEGDAIILSLMEYSNDEQSMVVSRACGLSSEIIKVVEANNEENRKNNLPVLELGIGVVYQTKAPTFLFDGDHKITISAAIGRSDRLSSCSKVVRPVLEKAADHDAMRHVDSFAISEDGQSKNDKGETHLRYNVNGIELDMPAFIRMSGEIKLKPFDTRLPDSKFVERYYIGHYKNSQGVLSFVAVRQGRTRLWSPDLKQRKVVAKQYYFEVIADQKRLGLLKNLL